ncbi:GlxA family transcriptional regulator [Amycolatopsis sp. H20-H5]|uniref:GlxA family transcriptional regulator n=1 Tax=Amycolatopsis sp. H20-H5 TaxID=3046309 RepID=UPI002DBF620B|nr:helix-turn-helix domain-containing protein [Amycolatopsis sp. H20-H5]MEC3980822.1 helix-turn-helix domain-containing protein [Amycolatopsis sp. H20-H5]
MLALDGVVLLEFGAAAQFFGRMHRDPEPMRYEFLVASADGENVNSMAGVPIGVAGGLELLRTANTIIVPGYNLIFDSLPAEVVTGLQDAMAAGTRVVSICTGAFALGHAGLLDGKQVTTHWAQTDRLGEFFPGATVLPNVLYVRDGLLYSSGGVAAGIDLCLSIVREDFGATFANRCARLAVVSPHRSGDQAQFVVHDLPRATGIDMAELLAWLDEQLGRPLAVADMAQHIGYSQRSFGRHFRDQVGTSPWQWLTRRRVERARLLLETSDLPISQIAQRCGFESVVSFRRRFRELIHVSPSDYRRTFRGDLKPQPA